MKSLKEIQEKIDTYQKSLDGWNEQLKKINAGEIPDLSSYTDMVIRMVNQLVNQIEELKWVIS